MPDFIVKAKIPGESNWAAFGLRSFTLAPRVGDVVGMDLHGVGYAFRVVGIHHPIEPTMTAGDLYISQIGPLHNEVLDLFRRS